MASVALPGVLAEQMTVIDLISESGIIARASGNGSLMKSTAGSGAHSQFEMVFNVTEQPVGVSLDVQLTANGQGGLWSLSHLAGDSPIGTLHFLGVGDGVSEPPGTVSDTFEGILDIGRYGFGLEANGFTLRNNPAANASWDFKLVFSDLIRWENAVSGVFQTGGNWRTGAPPSGTDNATIDRPGTYTINLAGNAEHKRLNVTGDGVNVSFDLNGFDYVLDEIRIGGLDGDSVSVAFEDSSGVVVSAASAVADDGSAQIAGGGSAGSRRLEARLLKAGLGGRVTISAQTISTLAEIDRGGRVNATGVNANWNVSELTVGNAGDGTFEVSDGGVAVALRTVLGDGAAGLGRATVTGADSAWDSRSLIVGKSGTAQLNIDLRALVTGATIVVGDRGGSNGTVVVTGSAKLLQNSTDSLMIGHAGTGAVDVTHGATVEVGQLSLGVGSNSDGRLAVESLGQVKVGDVLSVGVLGRGRLIVDGGSVARIGAGSFTRIGLTGAINVFNGSFHESNLLTVLGSFTVSSGTGTASVGTNQIMSPGRLTVGAGGRLTGNGFISGNVTVLAGGVNTFSGVVFPGASPGTLTIDGNYEQTGGLLGIEVAGTAPGQFDVLAVTGNATLGGDLLLEFIDGFAPRQGDEFKFLDVGGALSGAFASFEIRNLAPGFQFDLRSDAGGLTMIALNDGVFVPEPATLAMLFAGMLAMCFRRRAAVP